MATTPRKPESKPTRKRFRCYLGHKWTTERERGHGVPTLRPLWQGAGVR